MVCPYKEILLSNIKELTADPNNMSKPPVKKARLRRLYTEWFYLWDSLEEAKV